MQHYTDKTKSMIMLALGVIVLLVFYILEIGIIMPELAGNSFFLLCVVGVFFLVLSALFYGRYDRKNTTPANTVPRQIKNNSSPVNVLLFVPVLIIFLWFALMVGMRGWASKSSDVSIISVIVDTFLLFGLFSGLVSLVSILLGKRQPALYCFFFMCAMIIVQYLTLI